MIQNLQFDQSGSNQTLRTNLKNLYGVERVPSDTAMREILDPSWETLFKLIIYQTKLEVEQLDTS